MSELNIERLNIDHHVEAKNRMCVSAKNSVSFVKYKNWRQKRKIKTIGIFSWKSHCISNAIVSKIFFSSGHFSLLIQLNTFSSFLTSLFHPASINFNFSRKFSWMPFFRHLSPAAVLCDFSSFCFSNCFLINWCFFDVDLLYVPPIPT